MDTAFFFAAKIFWLLARPLTLGLVVLALGTVLLWLGRRRAGTVLVTVTVAALVVAEFTTLSAGAVRALENRFPTVAADSVRPHGIIVLGGALASGGVAAARGQVGLNGSAERMTVAAGLMRRHPDAVLAFTGHSGALVPEGWSEAEQAARLFADLGLDPARLVFEDVSRNTWENGVLLKDLVDPQPGQQWLLVTSAFHMARAVGVFRRAGWQVTPFPVDYRTPPDARCCLRSGGGLGDLGLALREAIGLVAYRASGRSAALWPSP